MEDQVLSSNKFHWQQRFNVGRMLLEARAEVEFMEL